MSLAARIGLAGAEREVVDGLRPEIQRLANVSTLEIMDGGSDAAGCARLSVAGAEVLIPLAGVLDPEVERARIAKRLADVETEAARSRGKLANPSFVSKAPGNVVRSERDRLAALEQEAAALAAQREELG